MSDHYDVARVVFKTGEIAIVFMESDGKPIVPIGMFPQEEVAMSFKQFLEAECSDLLQENQAKFAVRTYGQKDREKAKQPGTN